MKTTRRLILGACLAATLPLATQAQNLTEIKVSYQPALYWALPFHIATEKGWWAELGLKPVFSTFPAGVPQIAASASKSWDVGGTGGVPAVLGHVRFGIKTIGVSNDESAGNALLARKEVADRFMKDPASIKGQTIVLTANSTGDYAVQSCLKRWGLSKADVTIKNMGQAEIISAMSSNNADLGGLWAPNIYTMEEKAGARVLCSGKEGGAFVPGALIVRGEYAEQQPENVAKFLAIYLRAWSWANANKAEAIAMMKKFYEQGGVNISEASMHKEFDTRPTYNLEQQLANMNRAGGAASRTDGWFAAIGEFMRGTGAVPAVPAPADFVTDAFMKRVAADPKLREFANRTK
ncbi:MAG: ABC transporter substrate-binding protein [Rubrivivax sp.]|nr:ABC transporter substrate-binding protein [Rubrivivax sp.]